MYAGSKISPCQQRVFQMRFRSNFRCKQLAKKNCSKIARQFACNLNQETQNSILRRNMHLMCLHQSEFWHGVGTHARRYQLFSELSFRFQSSHNLACCRETVAKMPVEELPVLKKLNTNRQNKTITSAQFVHRRVCKVKFT